MGVHFVERACLLNYVGFFFLGFKLNICCGNTVVQRGVLSSFISQTRLRVYYLVLRREDDLSKKIERKKRVRSGKQEEE